MNTRLIAATFGCLAVTAALHAAQSNAPAGQQPPTFRSGVQLIEVDATVRDAKGRLVRGLTRDDFEAVRRRQPVRTCARSGWSTSRPSFASRPGKGVPETIDADVDSNANSGRVYVMLLDNPPGVPFSHIYLTQRTARRFVDQALAPDDLMAIIDVQDGYGSQAFTHSRQRLLAAIDRFGRSAIGDFAAFDAERRFGTENSYGAMRFVAERLGSIGNRRKAIIWIGGVVPFFPTMASDAVAYRDAVRAAARNNVAIYPVDPHGLTNTHRARGAQSAWARCARSQKTPGGLRRRQHQQLLRRLPAHRRGEQHLLRARLLPRVRTRPTADSTRSRSARSRPGPCSCAPGRATWRRRPRRRQRQRRPLPQGLSHRPRSTRLRSVVPVDGLPLTMFAAPFKGTGGGGSVLLGARLGGGDLKLDAEDRIEISQIAIDGDSQDPSRHAPDRSASLSGLTPASRSRTEDCRTSIGSISRRGGTRSGSSSPSPAARPAPSSRT